jgi:hypothetical protein
MDKWTRRKFFLATLTGGIAASTRRLFGAAGPERKILATSDDAADSAAAR